MREKIAKALYDDDDVDAPRFGWEHDTHLHSDYLMKADVVLDVMDEPTEAMIDGAFPGRTSTHLSELTPHSWNLAKTIWQDMIRAAKAP